MRESKQHVFKIIPSPTFVLTTTRYSVASRLRICSEFITRCLCVFHSIRFRFLFFLAACSLKRTTHSCRHDNTTFSSLIRSRDQTQCYGKQIFLEIIIFLESKNRNSLSGHLRTENFQIYFTCKTKATIECETDYRKHAACCTPKYGHWVIFTKKKLLKFAATDAK